jgi:hypothetical protein
MRADRGEDALDELIFDWDRYQTLAIDWEHHEARFQEDWERKFPKGPAWGRISDYHRYGYAGRRLYPDDPRSDLIHRIRRGYDRGEWDTRDPWALIEAAIQEGWDEAATGG